MAFSTALLTALTLASVAGDPKVVDDPTVVNDPTSDREASMLGEPADPASDGDDDEPPAPVDDTVPANDGADVETDERASPATDDRESDMFGDASASDDDTSGDGASRDDALFGESSEVRDTASSLFSAAQGFAGDIAETTDFGGTLFLRMNAAWRENFGIKDVQPSAPSLIDIYADARPNDRIRGFAQMRLNYDFTVLPGETSFTGQPLESLRLNLDQAWVKFDLARVAYVTAGRQRIRWGTGRFWNPTDFINQDIRNSVDFFDQRLGVNLVKVHFPLETLGWNLYLIGVFDGLDVLADTGIAARAEFLVLDAEIAFSTLVKEDTPLRIGGDASWGLWIFDFRFEGTVQRGLDQPRYVGPFNLETGQRPVVADTDDDWFVRAVFGTEVAFNYSDTDSITFGGEYFYNQAGYDSATIYPFLLLNGAFTPLYLGRHYVAGYAFAANPFFLEDISFTFSTLANVSDFTALSRIDVAYRLMNALTLNAFAGVHYGSIGEFHLGVDVPPQPGVPGLENGFKLENDLFDFGVAARVAF